MTSKLRNKLICILFLLFSFVFFFSTNNYFAKADTVTLGSLQNADFNWSNDISLEYSENTEYSKESFDIKFDFFLKNSKHSNIRNFITYYKNWWGTTLVQTFNYNFTLYAATDESTPPLKPTTTFFINILHPLRLREYLTLVFLNHQL